MTGTFGIVMLNLWRAVLTKLRRSHCPELKVRHMVALFSIAHGVLRLLPPAPSLGATIIHPVSILPSWVYGTVMLTLGLILLLVQENEPRGFLIVHVASAVAAAGWLLLAFDVFSTSWASGVNAAIIAFGAASEVRIREP